MARALGSPVRGPRSNDAPETHPARRANSSERRLDRTVLDVNAVSGWTVERSNGQTGYRIREFTSEIGV